MNFKILIGSALLLLGTVSLEAQINVKRTLQESDHLITGSYFSPDGKYIATIGLNNTILLWNAETGIIYRTLAGSKERIHSICFAPDNRSIYSAGEDGSVSIWDPALLSKVAVVAGHNGPVKALALSRDGKFLASGGKDEIIRLWNVKKDTLTLVYELSGHGKEITSLDFSPDCKRLASGSADKNLMVWEVAGGRKVQEIKDHDGWIRCVEFSPDGKYIASGGDDRLVNIRNAGDLSLFRSLDGHKDWVQTLDFSISGKYLLSGGHDHYIILWDVEKGEQVVRSEKLEHIVMSVDFNPTGSDFISSCLMSEKLNVWASGTEMESAPVLTEVTGAETEKAYPLISLYSPEPAEGITEHEGDRILLIGKVEDPSGIRDFLINKESVALSKTGIFQKELELLPGENRIELLAFNTGGKFSRQSITVRSTAVTGSEVTGQGVLTDGGKYYALIIGVNDYIDPQIIDLDYPIQDAESLYRTLIEKYSFQAENIHLLKNPTRTEIIIALDQMSQVVTTSDNLLIFYAGHGYWDEKTGIGFWMPHDASRSNTANWLRNSTLRDYIGSIGSRHTLLIADACFSGSIFKTRSAMAPVDPGIKKLYELSSRKAMTSGTLKEVPDKSVFIKYLVQGLDENTDEYLPSEVLFSRLKTAVLNNSPNVPQYGTIQNAGDEGGDFIFIRKESVRLD